MPHGALDASREQVQARAEVLFSSASQGPLERNFEVGAGYPQKSVFETYRLPLSMFTDVEPALDLRHLAAIAWIFDSTETGALVMDDLVFTQQGNCE